MGAFPHIRYAAKSDIGRKRTNNEDAFGAFPSSGIFCVADGMGGGDDGEVASAATIKAVERFTKECPIPEKFTYPIEGIVSGVRNAVNSASSWIAKRAKQKGLKGCGSTFVGICFDAAKPNTAIALHAGDSRLYRIRGRSIEQMTVDHSAAELIGVKNDKEVNPMFRGMILRAVGIQPSVELERTEVQLKARDRILICSDGLSRMVSDRKLLSIIREGEDLETTADMLIAAANNAGGVDNITVELIEVGDFPMPLPTSPLVSAVSADPTLETESVLIGDTNTHKTKGNDISIDITTEDDFIPSTAGDGDVESAEEDLNIPESDTEDDSPAGVPMPRPVTAALPRHPFLIKLHTIVCRLMVNRFVIIGLILTLVLACYVVWRVYSRVADVAKEKSAVEAKIHVKDQKDSLQMVEARRKAEQEQKAREAEKERARAEIKTPAKQKELNEKARKAAERRDREEKAARERIEADVLREKAAKVLEKARQEELRKAEELRQAKELEEAKAKAARAEAERKERERLAREEAARLEQLRKAEEEKKLKAAEEAKERARKEAEERARKEKVRLEAEETERQRKEAERLKLEAHKAEEAKALVEKQERERREREAKAKQEQTINAFMDVVKDGAAAKFYAKIKDRIPNSIPPDLHCELSQAGNPKLSRTDQIAAIVALTKDVQQVSHGLMEYSSLTLENVNSDLADATNEKQTKDFLSRIRDGIMAFDLEAGDFIDLDASSPDTQMKCIHIIRSVPKWFDF